MKTTNRKQRISGKMKAVTTILFCLFLFFFVSGNAQTTTYIKSESYLFSFKENNDMLLADYGDNVYQLERLGKMLQLKREQLFSGRYHLLIISHVSPYTSEDPEVLNEASLRANRIRTYMKSRFSISQDSVAFYIDRSGNFRDGVHVYLIHGPLPWFANCAIWYSESRYPNAIKMALQKYGSIPYVDMYLRGELKGYDRVVYQINDALFERSELEDYRLASVVDEQARTAKEKAPPVYEATTITTSESLRLVPATPADTTAAKSPKAATTPKAATLPPVARKAASPVFLSFQTNLLPWFTVAPSVMLGTGDTKVQTGSFMPNLKVECFFADRWSIALGGLYSDFSYKDKSRDNWAVSKISLEPRFWFLPGKFAGFNTGLFVSYGDFDVRGRAIAPVDNENLYGRTGRFWSLGASVGYLLPLGAGFSAGANLQAGYQCVSEGKKYRFDKPGNINIMEAAFSSTGFMLGMELNLSYRFQIR